MYLQLAKFTQHYVAVIVADSGFKYALIEVKEREFGMGEYFITDFGWVEAEKFLKPNNLTVHDAFSVDPSGHPSGDISSYGPSEIIGNKRKRSIDDVGHLTELSPRIFKDPFDISLEELRDLHAYCRARVAHIFIESQLKARSIPYVHVRSHRLHHTSSAITRSKSTNPLPTTRPPIQNIQSDKSPLVQHLPILCVQSSDMLAGGAAAAEAAMPNICIEPMEWWTLDRECTVHTSVQLKYVQPLDGAKSTNKKEGTLIRPSENISYDTQSSVITFLSRDVNECVGEFLEEWARVSKVVVIARQGTRFHISEFTIVSKFYSCYFQSPSCPR
jgi:mediator of RNA polymerase II transcription subunit 14